MTDAGLVWVEPSKTTVEGLATLIEALTKRVDQAEKDIDELQAVALKPEEGTEAKPEENLWDAIDAEVTRATKAEEALGKRIDAIDFIDGEELDVELAKKADKSVVDAMYTNAKIDELIQEAKDYADENDANDNTTYTISYEEKVDGEDGHPARIKLTPSVGEATYVDATPFIKDGMLDNVSYDADTNTLTFVFNTDAGKEAVDVELTDILAPYSDGDTETISVNIDDKNTITAEVIKKSITEAYLSDSVNADIQKGVKAYEFVGEDLIDTEGGLKSLLDGKQDTLVAEEDYATPD